MCSCSRSSWSAPTHLSSFALTALALGDEIQDAYDPMDIGVNRASFLIAALNAVDMFADVAVATLNNERLVCALGVVYAGKGNSIVRATPCAARSV